MERRNSGNVGNEWYRADMRRKQKSVEGGEFGRGNGGVHRGQCKTNTERSGIHI